MLFAVSCEKSNTNSETPVEIESALNYSVESIEDHNVVIVKPTDLEPNAPVVIILTDDLELATRAAETPNVNFKAAEHCLIGGYALCVVETSGNADVSFLPSVKATFPEAAKFYLLSYCNGLTYTAVMQMPNEFAAFGCVSGAIDVNVYKSGKFQKAVPFVHVHAKSNSVYKWNGVTNKSVSVPLSVGAIVAINECLTFNTTELLPREGKGRVSCTHYTNALSGCDVKFYSVESASNGWCDEEFEVYNQIWNFFKTH